MVSHHQMDTSLCRAYCLYHGFQYAGIREGHRCGCGNQFVEDIKGGMSCDIACSGDNREECGGATTMSVYQTGYHLGCFKEKQDAPAFPHRAPTKADIQTVKDCRRYCRGDSPKFAAFAQDSEFYEFAAVHTIQKNGNAVLQCRCGHNNGIYGAAKDKKCEPCKREPGLKCGAGQPGKASSVYQTGARTRCVSGLKDGESKEVKCPRGNRLEHVLFADFGSSNISTSGDQADIEEAETEEAFGDCLVRDAIVSCGKVAQVQCPLGTNLVSGGASGASLRPFVSCCFTVFRLSFPSYASALLWSPLLWSPLLPSPLLSSLSSHPVWIFSLSSSWLVFYHLLKENLFALACLQ